MSKEIVAGRSALKRTFKDFFSKSIDEGKETRSFLSFRKQKEPVVPPPWLYLFHGEECLGKTTAINYCIALADEIVSELKRTMHAVIIDWDERMFTKGSIPGTNIELMDAMVEAFEESDKEFSGNFSSYKRLSEQIKSQSSITNACLKTYLLDKAIATSGAPEIETTAQHDNILPLVLSKQEYELHESGERKLAELLINGIAEAAEEIPLILAIDSYTQLAGDLEAWFRTEIIKPLNSRRNRLTLIIGGETSLVRHFRNDFPDDSIFAVNFSDISLTRQTIGQIASKVRVTLTDSDMAIIERTTAGIPLLVHDILFYCSQNIPLSELCDNATNDIQAADRLTSAILTRFLNRCTETLTKDRVFALAMLSIFNAKALAEIWNIPFSDVKHALDALEKQTSFVKNQTMHAHIRKLFRISLIHEASLTTQSSHKPFFVDFSTANTRIFKEMLAQLQTAIPAAEKRCNDNRYLSGIEQMVCGMMWSSPTDALIALPGFYLELIHFNLPAAMKLLDKISEFRPVFSPVNDKVYKQLVSGLSLLESKNIFNHLPVKTFEDDLVAYFESVTESMNAFQRALFYHVKAEVDIRKNNCKEAMEHLNRSFSLLGNSSPEKSILYVDYVMLGDAFHRTGEHRNAIDTFSNAVCIKPDGFVTWYNMGLSRMALLEFEGAINAFCEAVKIDPAHSEAWYNLGLSYIREEQHEEAVDALIKAGEVSPEHPETWFVLGKSYSILGQHTEALKAFKKAVLLQADNGEAWILLGHACSALGTAEEAIEAYKKAIELKPKSVEPLKALGQEYFRLKHYDNAVEIFTKATRISKKDDDLWCFIAESHIGSGNFELAVEAGNKACALSDKNPRTWSAIGNAYMKLNKSDEAIAAFQKSVDIDPDNAAIWQHLGAIYTLQKDHDQAIAAFKKAVAFDPSLKEVWYTIGKSYESQKLYAEAISAYEKGVATDPDNLDCWFHKGEMHILIDQHDDAFDSFGHVVKIDTAYLDGWFNRGTCALRISNYPEAVNSFAKVVELANAHVEGWFNLGLAYQKLNDHQEAIRSFTKAVAHDHSRTDVWLQLGLSCQTLGIYEEAVSAFEKCSELAPTVPEYPTRLGVCYFAIDNFDKAHVSFKKAVELDPDNMDTLYHLALTAHSQEHFSEAIEHYLAIIKKKEDHAEAWFNCALAYHANTQYEKAVEVYLDYIKKWSDNGMAYFNLGLAYHAANDLDHAIFSYREALKLLPEHFDIWYHLGIALHTREQFGDAIQAYRKVLQLSKEHVNAWFNLGMAYYVWQNYADAIDAYTNVVKLEPSHFTAWGNIAIANYAANDYKQGYEAACKAYEINADEAWLVGNMVVGALFNGNSTQAQELATRLRGIDGMGDIITQTISQIEAGLKNNPSVEGCDAVIQKLQGITKAEPTTVS